MDRINALREQFPEAARDIKLNLQNVLGQTELSKPQAWGTALACAYATKDKALWTAVLEDAKAAGVEDGTLDDAKAAAILMGMNNVYYRFRHIIGKEEYSQMPARLREAAKLGFQHAIMPKLLRRSEPWPEGIEVIEVRSLRQALEAALIGEVKEKH
jgi:hypothetical protein